MPRECRGTATVRSAQCAVRSVQCSPVGRWAVGSGQRHLVRLGPRSWQPTTAQVAARRAFRETPPASTGELCSWLVVSFRRRRRCQPVLRSLLGRKRGQEHSSPVSMPARPVPPVVWLPSPSCAPPRVGGLDPASTRGMRRSESFRFFVVRPQEFVSWYHQVAIKLKHPAEMEPGSARGRASLPLAPTWHH